MFTRKFLSPLFALALALFVPACTDYDTGAEDENVAEAEGAFIVYPDPTVLKTAITNGATHDPSYDAFVVNGDFKRPALVDNVWTLVDPASVTNGVPSWDAGALPILPVTYAFLCAGDVWDEADSNELAGVPDYAGIVYVQAGASCGDHTFEESWRTIISGQYPSTPAGTYCKLGDP